MSDVGRFVSLAVPDLFEIGAKIAINHDNSPPRVSGLPKRPRKPPILGLNKETTVNAILQPEVIQASLDASLAKYVDLQPTPERQSEVLIKIGLYRMELAKYAPVLRDADPDLVEEVIGTWLAAGDTELRKAVYNSTVGSEELPLHKAAPETGPDVELAKLVDAAPEGGARMTLLQHIGSYSMQAHALLNKAEALQVSDADRATVVADWVAGGDGSHQPLKKLVADLEVRQRGMAKRGVTETDAVEQKVGNASSHAASKLGATTDSAIRTIPRHSTGEGAGPRMPGSEAAPGQDSAESPSPGSGGGDHGAPALTPSYTIRRKGTTGGLGSVAGAEGGAVVLESGTQGESKKKKKPPFMDKGGDLAVELVKVAPEPFVTALGQLEPDDQFEVCQVAAQHAADLMAWSAQQSERLQKRALDAAITDWLAADPDSVQLKKWTAEALASAEAIPLELGKAIMGWQAPPVSRAQSPAAAAAPRVQLRQPYPVTA